MKNRDNLQTFANVDERNFSIDSSDERYEKYKQLKSDLVKISPKAKKIINKMKTCLIKDNEFMHGGEMSFSTLFTAFELAAFIVCGITAIATCVLGNMIYAAVLGTCALAVLPHIAKIAIEYGLSANNSDYFINKYNKLADELAIELENNRDKLAEHTATLQEILETYHGIELKEKTNSVQTNVLATSKEEVLQTYKQRNKTIEIDKEIDEK